MFSRNLSVVTIAVTFGLIGGQVKAQTTALSVGLSRLTYDEVDRRELASFLRQADKRVGEVIKPYFSKGYSPTSSVSETDFAPTKIEVYTHEKLPQNTNVVYVVDYRVLTSKVSFTELQHSGGLLKPFKTQEAVVSREVESRVYRIFSFTLTDEQLAVWTANREAAHESNDSDSTLEQERARLSKVGGKMVGFNDSPPLQLIVDHKVKSDTSQLAQWSVTSQKVSFFAFSNGEQDYRIDIDISKGYDQVAVLSPNNTIELEQNKGVRPGTFSLNMLGSKIPPSKIDLTKNLPPTDRIIVYKPAIQITEIQKKAEEKTR